MAKCAAYLHRGIGVVVVDVVTNRLANLHNDLMAAVGGPTQTLLTDTPTYVAAYGPVSRNGRGEVDMWCHPAPVGLPVPSVPLALRRGPLVMLDLDGTYTEATTDSGL